MLTILTLTWDNHTTHTLRHSGILTLVFKIAHDLDSACCSNSISYRSPPHFPSTWSSFSSLNTPNSLLPQGLCTYCSLSYHLGLSSNDTVLENLTWPLSKVTSLSYHLKITIYYFLPSIYCHMKLPYSFVYLLIVCSPALKCYLPEVRDWVCVGHSCISSAS